MAFLVASAFMVLVMRGMTRRPWGVGMVSCFTFPTFLTLPAFPVTTGMLAFCRSFSSTRCGRKPRESNILHDSDDYLTQVLWNNITLQNSTCSYGMNDFMGCTFRHYIVLNVPFMADLGLNILLNERWLFVWGLETRWQLVGKTFAIIVISPDWLDGI